MHTHTHTHSLSLSLSLSVCFSLFFFSLSPSLLHTHTHTQTYARMHVGVIHGDFEKHFICADVYSFKDFKENGFDEKAVSRGSKG